ncbi:MAG: hypothetical protein Kow00124_03720 [Anaerolineae bacterium]
MILLLIIGLLIALLAVIFAAQNTMTITVRFLFWSVEGSLALALLAAFALGVIAALMVSLPGLIRRTRTINSQKKELANLSKDLEKLRAEKAAPSTIVGRPAPPGAGTSEPGGGASPAVKP